MFEARVLWKGPKEVSKNFIFFLPWGFHNCSSNMAWDAKGVHIFWRNADFGVWYLQERSCKSVSCQAKRQGWHSSWNTSILGSSLRCSVQHAEIFCTAIAGATVRTECAATTTTAVDRRPRFSIPWNCERIERHRACETRDAVAAKTRSSYSRHHGFFSCDTEHARTFYHNGVETIEDLQEHERDSGELGATCSRCSPTARRTSAGTYSQADTAQALRTSSRSYMEAFYHTPSRSFSIDACKQALAFG